MGLWPFRTSNYPKIGSLGRVRPLHIEEEGELGRGLWPYIRRKKRVVSVDLD